MTSLNRSRTLTAGPTRIGSVRRMPALAPVAITDQEFRRIDRGTTPVVAPDSPAHRWERRYAATREIRDHDSVADLAPVTQSLHREQVYRRALGVADGGAALAAICGTAALWGAAFSWLFLLVPFATVLIAKVQGMYDRDDMVLRKSTLSEWRPLLRTSALVTIANYLVWLASTDPAEGRGLRVFAFMVMGMFALVVPGRGAARRIARRLTADERCLVVGQAESCEDLMDRLRAIPGLDLIGAISDDDVDCSVAGIHELVEQLNVQRIVAVPHAGWGDRGTLKLIQSAKWLGVRVSLMPSVLTVVGAYAATDEIDAVVLLGVPRFGLSRSSEALKRAFDLLGATTTLLLTSPLLIAIAIAVKLDGAGAVLFRQERIGRDGRPFMIYKFRSMVDDAEQLKARLGAQNETSGLFKMTDDPRVTRVGRFLRRTYLDELPQLINVVRGEMSLVGPRPLIACEDALLAGYDRHRSRLTPGMTGPWQLRGPISASLPELAKLDYMYASNWKIWADIDILLGTAARVLTRHGR
jgi:exopolysaccharide biosynthesis polyprenyl glycosylphosphotransferase